MQDSHNKYFYQLFAERKFTNWKCLSIPSPIRQITSKETLILKYFTLIISDSSRGNRSVGMIGRPLYVSLKFILLVTILRCRHGSYLFCPGYQAVHHRQIQQYRQLLQVYVSVLLRLLSGKGSQNCIPP